MGKRTFTRDFKPEAVRMVKERGLAKAQVARDIGVHPNVLKSWLDQHDADPQGAFGGTSAKTVENAQRGGPTNLDKIRGRDKWNSEGYAAAASG